MRHARRGRKLSRDAAHRDALLMNLAGSLIEHGRIRTTIAKAKELRPYVEKLVTQARKGDLHSRRTVLKKLRMHDSASARDKGKTPIVEKLFNEVAPRFADRPGGYTRIIKLGPRSGDSTEMAFIEFVDFVPQAPSAPSYSAAAAHSHDHEHAGHAHA